MRHDLRKRLYLRSKLHQRRDFSGTKEKLAEQRGVGFIQELWLETGVRMGWPEPSAGSLFLLLLRLWALGSVQGGRSWDAMALGRSCELRVGCFPWAI